MACCETLIISAEQVRTTTGISGMVHDRKFVPFLRSAQAELEKILGRTMYNELDQAIIADPTLAASDKYRNLMPYVRDLLAWRTLQYALPRMGAEPTANGVHSVNTPEYQNADGRVMGMQVSQARSSADTAQERMTDFIIENKTIYENFGTNVGSEERITKAYPGGVITRKSKWQNPLLMRTGRKERYDD